MSRFIIILDNVGVHNFPKCDAVDARAVIKTVQTGKAIYAKVMVGVLSPQHERDGYRLILANNSIIARDIQGCGRRTTPE